MEGLSLHDRPPPGQPHPGPRGPQMMGPPPVPQLPPQMFTTAAQLLDLTDKKLVAILRDGRKYVGVLRSWDQFGNLVLQDTVERIFGGQQYADVSRGLFLIRGENVLLLGEIDLDKDDHIPEPYTKGDVDEVYALYKQETDAKKVKDKSKQKAMKDLGFVEGETGADVLL
ncbi:Sm-like ribonucleoprotein [Myriangium duriaei CBS 260.36]|uniref:U6 snRNA-associated Sm-like protein LSm1 n=1 Tax=Myriangium duriaei CBS 260.36 TaxID=1168546 RepID=A0A9P4MIE8_9PEZI|nr:Sm-like ribonucleoprotein [Myriangium duriaei CBS 260.36]